MSCTPKPPLGFVPVDSEEAMGIAFDVIVNYCYARYDTWRFGNNTMAVVIGTSKDWPNSNFHVQLPPPVEWEEVWGWSSDRNGIELTKNGRPITLDMLTSDALNTIVRALNEMEGRDG